MPHEVKTIAMSAGEGTNIVSRATSIRSLNLISTSFQRIEPPDPPNDRTVNLCTNYAGQGEHSPVANLANELL